MEECCPESGLRKPCHGVVYGAELRVEGLPGTWSSLH